MAAGRLHPSVASNLVFLLSTDWITEALDQEPDQEPDQQDARAWGCFGELFDAGSEQYRDRAGSAYDYVRYSSDDDDGDIVGGSRSRSSSDGGFDDEEGNAVHAVYGSGPWLGLDELFLAMDSLGFDLDSDSDSDDDSNSDFAGF
jgi:hypothetical protein